MSSILRCNILNIWLSSELNCDLTLTALYIFYWPGDSHDLNTIYAGINLVRVHAVVTAIGLDAFLAFAMLSVISIKIIQTIFKKWKESIHWIFIETKSYWKCKQLWKIIEGDTFY